MDRLKRHAIVGRCITKSDAELGFCARREPITASGLTGLCATEFQYMASSTLLAEIMVEREHAIDLGVGD